MSQYKNKRNSIHVHVTRKNRMRQPRLPSQSSFDMNVSMAREEGKAGFVAYYRSVRDFRVWGENYQFDDLGQFKKSAF